MVTARNISKIKETNSTNNKTDFLSSTVKKRVDSKIIKWKSDKGKNKKNHLDDLIS